MTQIFTHFTIYYVFSAIIRPYILSWVPGIVQFVYLDLGGKIPSCSFTLLIEADQGAMTLAYKLY